jgi:rhamnosyltransferase
MSNNSAKYITVFVPSYNGADYIGACIDAILGQQLPNGYGLELLIIDSGSRDNSMEIIKSYGDKVNFSEIPNSEFSHGGTRDKAARMAKGEFVLFLSQDATPLHDRWLINMIEPFFLSPQIGCVYGRQRPRPNAAATIKREVATVFGSLGSPDTVVVSRWKSLVDGHTENPSNDFFSDVNSASRRELLVGKIPFRHIAYSEDQALAQDMQAHGYLKAYSPKGEVWHSNEYTAKQYFHRKFDEFIGLHDSTGYKLVASKRSLLLGWIRPTLHDWKFIRHDGEYSSKSKIVWTIEAPFFNIAAKAGQYMAAKHAHDKTRNKQLSLEERNKD